MRIGDFEVSLTSVGAGELIECADGRVLARPGQVYSIRMRNDSDQRAVAHVSIDGLDMTEGGLVIGARGAVSLERPVQDGEHGRFTVFPEGHEGALGEDGGRDNPDLGLIEIAFRREIKPQRPPQPAPPPRRRVEVDDLDCSRLLESSALHLPDAISESRSAERCPVDFESEIRSAAGTGLTGRSGQDFITVHVGPLEKESTIIRLRLVIGAPSAFQHARPLPGVRSNPAPVRPVPLP